jgi:hypothetical protein
MGCSATEEEEEYIVTISGRMLSLRNEYWGQIAP